MKSASSGRESIVFTICLVGIYHVLLKQVSVWGL